jgi:hypothetical protein
MYVATHQVETNLSMQTMENFNLSRTILIDQRGDQRRWEEWFARSPHLCKSRHPPPTNFANHPFRLLTSSPLDQNRATRIEVSVVCVKRSVSTKYVPINYGVT